MMTPAEKMEVQMEVQVEVQMEVQMEGKAEAKTDEMRAEVVQMEVQTEVQTVVKMDRWVGEVALQAADSSRPALRSGESGTATVSGTEEPGTRLRRSRATAFGHYAPSAGRCGEQIEAKEPTLLSTPHRCATDEQLRPRRSLRGQPPAAVH